MAPVFRIFAGFLLGILAWGTSDLRAQEESDVDPSGAGLFRALLPECLEREGPWEVGASPGSLCLDPGGPGAAGTLETPILRLGSGPELYLTLAGDGAEVAVDILRLGDSAWEPAPCAQCGPGTPDAAAKGLRYDLAPWAKESVRLRVRVLPAGPGDSPACLSGLVVTGIDGRGACTSAVWDSRDGSSPEFATALNESFSGGVPSTWTVVHDGDCTGPAATWTTANPGGRTPVSPIVVPFAIVDSDEAGSTGNVCTMDESLVTPALDLASSQTVTLRFDHYFRYAAGISPEIGDVDVRSTRTGGAWVNIRRYQGASSPNPETVTADITAQSAGASDTQIRFRYYNASWEWYWMVDNVRVDYTTCPLPGVPSGVSATTTSCNNIVVSWAGGSGATSHNLLRYSGACPSASGLVTFTGVTSPYTDATAVSGASYCYVVQAVNACGTTNSAAVTGTRLGIPVAPGSPSLTPGCTGMGLSWVAVPGASTYDIWRASGPSCSGAAKVNPSPVSGTTYADSGLALGTTYSYRLTASNACGTSAPGSCATASTLACAPLLVYEANGPWVPVAGDGDGAVEPGERWSVPLTLRNAGTLSATSAVASLSAAGVTVCNNPGSFGTIPPGATATASFLVAISTTFAQDYGCGSAATFAVVGKSCAEADPAGPDEAGAFVRAVGQAVAAPYAVDEAGATGAIPKNTTTLFATVNNPVASVPDPLSSCTVDIALTPPCNGLGNLAVRVDHDPDADGTYEDTQTVYSGPGSGWSDVTGFSLGTMVDGSTHGNGRWRLAVTHSIGLCTLAGTLHGWTLQLEGLATTWDCSSVGAGGCVAGPKPVPDGRWVPGQPVRAERMNADGSSVRVTWDATSCPAPGYNLYAGPLAGVSTYGYDDWTHCALGTSGQSTLTLAPGDLFFVVVPVSGSIEGSHGRTGTGAERPASGVGHCGVTVKETSGTCP